MSTSSLENKIKALQEGLASLQKAQAQVKVVFPPRERKLQKFSGVPGKDGEFYPLNGFLIDVEAVCDARHEATDCDKAGIIVSNLEGLARDEVKCLTPEQQKDPKAVTTALKAAFAERLTLSQLMAKFYARKQGTSESLQQYSLALKLLRRRIKAVGGDTTDAVARDVFIENISDRQLRRHLKEQVRSKADLSFCAVLDSARNWEEDLGEAPGKRGANVHQQGAQMSPPSSQSGASADLSSILDKQQQTLAELTSAMKLLLQAQGQGGTQGQGQVQGQEGQGQQSKKGPRRDGKGRLICYRCNLPGHIASRCRTELKQSGGHSTQGKGAQQAAVKETAASTNTQSGNGSTSLQ